jgi:alpha-L-rhamnosidase
MFGAPVAYLFEYLLGIRQTEDSAGYKSIIIEPMSVDRFKWMKGSITTPNGVIAVSYVNDNGRVKFNISVPENTEAVFRLKEQEHKLKCGTNEFQISETLNEKI